jgi:hypothetical protein
VLIKIFASSAPLICPNVCRFAFPDIFQSVDDFFLAFEQYFPVVEPVLKVKIIHKFWMQQNVWFFVN